MAGRPIKSLDRQTVTAYLDLDLAYRTRAYATETGHTLSSIVNDALKLYFERLDLIEAIDYDTLLQQLADYARAAIATEEGRA